MTFKTARIQKLREREDYELYRLRLLLLESAMRNHYATTP